MMVGRAVTEICRMRRHGRVLKRLRDQIGGFKTSSQVLGNDGSARRKAVNHIS
ncbi:hypothetical protein SERLADRAFT_374955 [Serpula lacrymans var. lacrymans S7.9]|uniref:Uncharacterized protein n=1 Tax=Serpula lacrymans var. lacrymans (strain S7.9) TaxID=578457 RepID=F8PDV5_SERL9|nr:uncharacterized protein SERLADRAFT_374955 [Serpula lacrymans var. lacrymans S7.9]EGO18552.1 hypothetical protein SERLADRAFT_374955 [Serpula lacrymans var. lacrymans S7.9]